MKELADLTDSPSPSSLNPRALRIGSIAMIICSLLVALISLAGFLTQGSQVRVSAKVLSEHCHLQYDIASEQEETRCDASVRFTATNGQVITTSVGDALPSEFHGIGTSETIDLRYDSTDPTAPFKQSNYMSRDSFVVTMTICGAIVLASCWVAARADQIVQRDRERSQRKRRRAR